MTLTTFITLLAAGVLLGIAALVAIFVGAFKWQAKIDKRNKANA